jgi:broad specificity phosphatase PhoE
MPLHIYLVRHGETEWSLSGRYTGRTDIPLTPRGEDAARKVGQRIRNILFTHVLTSPLQRARQTCELAGLATPAEIEPDLTEWDNGDDEGHLRADVIGSRPGWDLFRDGAPHGESAAQVSTRADRLISHLRALDGKVALFSHGHFGRVLGARWIGLSVEQAQHLLFDTAALSVLGYEHDRTDLPAILLWNASATASFDPAIEHPAGDVRPTRQLTLERGENEGAQITAKRRDQGRLSAANSNP